MDVFKLRENVVDEYRDYVESFVRVLDPRVNEFVREQLDRGELWPDAVLQLNPAFVPGKTLREHARAGTIHADTARFFGEDICLYQHQEEALEIGRRGEPFVVTTGTGSGKSLTYLIPIYDAIVRSNPEEHNVRAIIVYPMNALINSQHEALKKYAEQFPESRVRFDQYTGQTQQEDRDRIMSDRPHIILTNYVMLEYLLMRPFERTLLETATRDLRFLVMDELHFYRGRQGADVAMLMRRVSQKAGRNVQVIGTSATMTTEGTRDERRNTVAHVASTLFGVNVPSANVIDETLKQVARVPVPTTREELRQAVELEPPMPEVDAVTGHPLAAWAEEAFGLDFEEGRLVRRTPTTFASAVSRLANESDLSIELCTERLRAILDAGNEARFESDEPVFAFRLHQFLSSGSSIYTTLESLETRDLNMGEQYRDSEGRTLYPLAFCRECGQDYYLVSRIQEGDTESLIPRSPLVGAPQEDFEGEGGFFALDDGDLWDGDQDDLPEFWFQERKSGPRLRDRYADFVPQEYVADPDGSIRSLDDAGDSAAGVRGWFQPRPLMLCLRCRAAYGLREGDYRKLSSLSQTGRSTATTVTMNALVSGMAEQGVPRKEAKVLSFTDNRQDAALQAGHLNDFVQVAQLRAAIVKAIDQNGDLSFDMLGEAVFNALDPRPEDFMKQPVDSGPGYEQGRRTMMDLLEYRALDDLSRGWRIAQPNLEQSGLLRIEYQGLRELAEEGSLWTDLPAIDSASPDRREAVLRAFLDHLRMQLAIEAESLTDDRTRRLARNASQWLRDPWALEERDQLRTQSLALLPDVQRDDYENRQRVLSLGYRSAIARYLRQARTWEISENLSATDVEGLVTGIVRQLRGHVLSVVRRGSQERGVRVLAGALRWTAGDGQASAPDPVRSRRCIFVGI